VGPRPYSWILGVLRLRGRGKRGGEGEGRGRAEKGKGNGKGGEWKGKGKGRKGKPLWICSSRKNFLAKPLKIYITFEKVLLTLVLQTRYTKYMNHF